MRVIGVSASLALVGGWASLATVAADDPWDSVSWTIPVAAPVFDAVAATVAGVRFGSGDGVDAAGHPVVVSAPDGTKVGCGLVGHDPWNSVDINEVSGTAAGDIDVQGFSIVSTDGAATAGTVRLTPAGTAYNAFGHVLVVHAPDGTRVACGGPVSEGATVTFSKYPGYTGDTVTGNVITTSRDCGASDSSKCLRLALNLDTSAFCDSTGTCGQIHVHTGTSCAAAANVGGHLFREDAAIVSSSWGGSYAVGGVATVADAPPDSINFAANLINGAGFTGGTSGPIAIHSGTSCASAADTGDPLYEGAVDSAVSVGVAGAAVLAASVAALGAMLQRGIE